MTCVEGSTTAGIANWVQCTSLTVPKPNYNLTGKPSAKRFNNGDLKKSFDTNQSSFDSYYSGYFVNDADKYSELNDGWWVANWQTEITLIQNPFHVIRPVGTQATLETVAYGPSLKYQWYVATSATGTGTQIDSATNSTYAATVQSANRWYYCVISGTDSKGVAMSKTSARALVGPGETPVIDDTPPTGTISASTTCTNQNSVTLYVKAQDAISGVNNVNIVAWTGGEAYDKTCSTKAATYNSTKQQWEVTYTFTEIKNTTTGATNQGDNSYYFKGHIFDGAGNRAVTSAATVMYDTTAPTYGSYTVTGTTLTNGIRYAPSSTSEITLKFTALSDNLSGVKNIDAYMKKDGATRSNAYTVSSSISGTTGEVRFKLNGYGTYVTEMYLYDKAGNSKVLPAITIEVEQGDPLPKLMERDMYNYDDPEPSMIGARRADENTTYLAEKVLHIRFINLNEASEPTNYEATWDASYNDGEGEVTAWVVQSYEDSSMYDLIIGADDIIQAPKNSECLFAYYENCKSIEGLENLSTSNVTTMSHMFDGCGILGLNLNYFDTTNVQSMSCMFLNCQDIVELDLGSFNTSAVTDMSSMFCECRSLEYVNVSSFDTSKVTNMFSMFKCCYLLEDINITNFDTSLVVNIQEMFRQCSSLETVDLSHFATGYVQRMDYLFQDCTSLKYIDLSTQNFSAADPSTGMFQGCGNLESIKIGPIFCTLNWKYAFEDCTSLKAIISTSESPLFLVTTGNLQSLPNAILYVPSTTAEAAYEAADNYDTVFGADRVRPILELVGDSTVKVFTGSTYKDAGITVAGMDKDTVNSTYTPYGYTVSGPVIKKNGTVVSSIDTSTAGNTYTYTYTIKDSTNTEGMSVTRTVTVANPGRLMARESGISGTESYAIGAKRAGKTQYAADKIKTITLQGNLTAPKGYVDTWDVSENQDGSLAAWVVKNSEDSTMYDLYIGGNNEIKAPTAGYMLFAFYTKCTKINNLNLLNTSSTTGMRGFFYRLYELESLDLSNFSTASCTNTWDMFSDCKALTTLDVSNFDTSKLNYATYMFYGCMNVTNINLGNFVTTNVTSTSGMFYNCQKLTSVDVSTFDTSKVTNMSRMFSNCYVLKNLNLKNFDTSKVTNMSYMFSSTTSLLNLDLSSFNTTSVTNMDSMLFNSSNLLSLLIGNNFDKLTGASMFRSCSKLKRIITPRTSISTLNADSTTTTGLKTLTNVILYVPTLDAETTYESNAAYSDIFGSARIKPILELIGNNPRTIYQNMPYTDDGVTVAELYKNLDDTYTPFGYTVSGPVIRKNGTIVSEVDTSTLETYTLTYTVVDPSGVSGMSVTRTLTPGSKPVLMARDSDANGYYAIGAVRTAYDIADDMYLDYKADTIKTITLVDLSTTAAPTNYEATWDAGYDYGSNAVIAYIKANTEDSTMYDLYLCSYGTMYAPADSKTLFAYYTNCTNINNLELLDTSDATTMRGFFYKMESLQSVELSEFSTTNCTNMWDMFNNCKSLTSISVSSFDTSNLIYATWMFYGCSNVTNINLAGIDTTNVKSMSGMFYNCSKLASLDLSSFNTANVTDMGTMFRNCSTLKSLDLTSFNTSSVTNMDQMFSTCSNLTSMKLGANFDKLIGATMFTGCSNLKAIITPRTTILTLNDDTTTNTGLKTLANAILYVPSTTAETTFEAATSYADIFGASRIKPILELIGDNPVKASNGVTYVDSGVTVAGMTKNADGTTYTPYGYTVSGPVIKKDGTVVSNVDTSTKGTYTYTYTIKDSENTEGMSVTRDVNVADVPTLMEREPANTANRYQYYAIGAYRADNNTTYTADEIKKITLIDLSKESAPTTYVATWDASYTNGDGDVTAWLVTNAEDSTMYDLYLGAEGKIYAPNDSRELFYKYTNCIEINGLNNLDTRNVTNMYMMFSSCSSLTSLDLSNFNTSQVTNMYRMFSSCSSLTSLDLSNFNTSQVTNMYMMFSSCSSLTSLDLINFNTSQVTNMSRMFYSCSSLTSLDISGFNTSKVIDMGYMFYECNKLTSLDVSGFDTRSVTSMRYIFSLCRNLKSLDVSNFDTSKVTNMSDMFSYCNSLISIDVSNFDTSNVTNMHYMFLGCSKLTILDVSHFNTSNVTNMCGMFHGCSKLTILDVSNFDTGKVTDMSMMFESCRSVTNLDISHFDTSNVTSMFMMFYYCNSLTSIDVSNFDTSNVTNMCGMFDGCSKLTILDVSHFNTNKVTDMHWMFYSCSSLTSLDVSNFDTSNVTNMSNMFDECSSLTSLDVSGFDTSNVKTMGYMFKGCTNLKNIDLRNFDTSSLDSQTYSSSDTALDVDVNYMFSNCNNLESIVIGNKFNRLDGYDMFKNCGKLKAIITTKEITTANDAPTLSGTENVTNSNGKIIAGPNGLINLPNAILYVPNTTSETAYEAATNYDTVFGADRIRPILELVGENPVKVSKGATYVDSGVTVAGMTKNADGTTYTPYGYTVSGPVIKKNGTVVSNINTNTKGTYTYTYTIKDYSNLEGMSVTRDVIVKDNPTLMERDSKWDSSTYEMVYYAIGSYKRLGIETYTVDKIKKITLIDLSKESTPTTYEATWDASYTNGDGDVTAWLVTNAEDNTMYDLYLGAEGKIYAPSNSMYLFRGYENCVEINGLNNLDTSNVTNMHSMFYNCSSLTSLDLSNFDTSKVTGMSFMFFICSSLTNLDLSNFDTSKVTDMSSMFSYCSSLTNLDVSNFDTSKVTDMSYMFNSCSSLTSLDVSSFDTSKVTDMSNMFFLCSNLTSLDISKFDTGNVTTMHDMFYSCGSLTSLDVSGFDTSNVTDMGSMFYRCSSLPSLDVSNFDTSNVTDMGSMFYRCSSLPSLDISNFNTSKVTKMDAMFQLCSSLPSLDVSSFDTSKVTDMGYMFNKCSSLTSLDVSGFDTSNITDMSYMFYSCNKLSSIRLGQNFDKLTGKDMFSSCSNLKAIITPRTTIMTLNDNTTTSTGLKALTNAILYVPSTTAEATFETDANYADIFGADRIRPILELVGENPVKVSKGATYVDSGVTVAGMTKNADGTTYTPYSYTVSGPVIKKDDTVVSSVDTSNVGTYTLTYTVHEPNSSVDGMSVTREVKIESKDISENNPDITVSIPTEDRVYKDAEYKPVVTIKDNAKTLVENTDYTVSYSNNISAGMATITIKGINNYTGTRTINFIITQRAVTIKPKDASKVYDTLPLTSNVAEVTAGDLVTGHTATITTTGSITEVGSITNTISTLIIKNASGTDVTSNYDITKGVGTLTVTAADNVDFDITLDNNTFVYDGTEKEPGVTIKVNGVTLEEGKDYDVSYKNNIKAGTATVTIKGKGNYEGSSSTKDFTITVRLLEITAGSASKVYNGTALTSSAFSITSGTSLAPNQTLSVTTSGTITNVGTTSNVIATYGIYHSGEDVKSNYNVTLKEGTLEVKPATITGSVTITGTNRVGKTLTAEVTVDPNDASLTYAWYYGTTNDINNATAIAGANTKTYSPTTDKIGMYIFVKVTASKANYDSATFTDITDNENNKVEKVGDRLTPYLMAREVQTVTSNGVTSEKAGYAIGAYRAGKTKYTSDLIKSVTIINLLETNAPTTYEAMWDASRDEDEAVFAWAVKNQTNSSMYDLYIGGEGTLVLTNGKRLFADYTKCEEINGLNKMNSTNVTDMSYMFSNLASMSTLDVSVVNTSSVTNMEGMFMTNNLTTLNVSGFDTGKVTNMSKMFKESSNLTSLNINGFNTANANNMSQMFMDCGNITSLNVSAFNTSNVTNMSAMFMGMSKLETLNVTNFNTANVTDMSSMFASCLKVQRLDLHTFNTAKVTNINGMFTADSSMKSVLLGEEFNKLNGSNMFTGCSSLKAIIAQKKITASSEAMTLSATGTGLNTLTNAVLYVPNLESKGYYETATNYATVFGEARVKPILEIIGSNPVHVTVGTEYVDQGAKVAGFEESEATEYTVYGYTLSVSGLPVDTSTVGTKLVIYTVKYKDQIVVTGATW